VGFLALVPGDRARERIEQHVLGVFPHALGNVVVFERGRELASTCVASPAMKNSLKWNVAAELDKEPHHRARVKKRKLD
jgi:hypothetical protein